MPADNVEIVSRGFEAVAREGWEALLPLLDPKFEFTTPPDLEVFASRDDALRAAGLDPAG